MITSKTVYITDDGKEFSCEDEAVNYELEQSKKAKTEFDRYINSTYNGHHLLKKHSLSEHGIWKVYGEDPNCDFGGHHHSPYLGKFQGTLEEVIRHAVTLSGFWQWGAGGDFKLDNVEKITKLS